MVVEVEVVDGFSGVDPDLNAEQVEWGYFTKVGDPTTRQTTA